MRKRSKTTKPKLNVVDLEVTCYCGAPAVLQSNSLKYGREYGNGRAWFCSRWPECQGYVGTHPDGRPLGTLADPVTHRARMSVHDRVDVLWREEGYARGAVYAWLAKIMSVDHVHIGELDRDGCNELLTQIRKNPFPARRPIA